MSNKFRDFVEEVERDATPAERRDLDARRRQFGIGAKLLERRLAAGLSQRQLADLSGIGQGDISRIERGQGNPTVETLQALGGPLGVTLDFTPNLSA
nr:helix-turn-helix transcriptional regulator [Conexibacter arvalis]